MMDHTGQALPEDDATAMLMDIGVKLIGLRPEYAQEIAGRVISVSAPSTFPNGYTRAEVEKLCFRYLMKCNVQLDILSYPLEVHQIVDKYWQNRFLEKIEFIHGFGKNLPKLTGTIADIKKAEQIRQIQIQDLIDLKNLLNKEGDGLFADRSIEDKKLITICLEIAYFYLDEIFACSAAKFWLSRQSLQYNWQWLLEELTPVLQVEKKIGKLGAENIGQIHALAILTAVGVQIMRLLPYEANKFAVKLLESDRISALNYGVNAGYTRTEVETLCLYYLRGINLDIGLDYARAYKLIEQFYSKLFPYATNQAYKVILVPVQSTISP